MTTISRYFGVIGVCAVALFAPRAARAATCMNDIDCPDTECGGQVCDWSTMPQTCKPAGVYMQGTNGWCTTDTDCKCNKSEGATCIGVQCSRTLPKSAGDGPVASGGASGSAGASATAGSTSTAGSSASSAGASSSSSDASGSSGCSLGGGTPRGSLGLLGAVCAAALIGARRRRRAA